jgi:hypothetical protein
VLIAVVEGEKRQIGPIELTPPPPYVASLVD